MNDTLIFVLIGILVGFLVGRTFAFYEILKIEKRQHKSLKEIYDDI